jgi:glucosamine kinase
MRLAVDGGASTLRMAVVEGDRIVRQVETPGYQWTTGEDPVQQQCRRVEGAWRELGSPDDVETIALGLAGGAIDRTSRERLAALLAESLGARKVLLTGDDVTNHLGALAGEPGVVVAAGTGVACRGIGPDGRSAKVDGLGYLFGDAGGGFSIGLAGLRAALAAVEGRGPATSLVERAEKLAGTPLPLVMRTWYAAPTLIADVAGFAPEVGAAAEADPPDQVARAVCEHAGRELATSVTAAVRSGFAGAEPGTVAVSWSGGVLRSYASVFGAFTAALAELCPQATLCDPRGDSMAGAVRLASGAEVPHLAEVVAVP